MYICSFTPDPCNMPSPFVLYMSCRVLHPLCPHFGVVECDGMNICFPISNVPRCFALNPLRVPHGAYRAFYIVVGIDIVVDGERRDMFFHRLLSLFYKFVTHCFFFIRFASSCPVCVGVWPFSFCFVLEAVSVRGLWIRFTVNMRTLSITQKRSRDESKRLQRGMYAISFGSGHGTVCWTADGERVRLVVLVTVCVRCESCGGFGCLCTFEQGAVVNCIEIGGAQIASTDIYTGIAVAESLIFVITLIYPFLY